MLCFRVEGNVCKYYFLLGEFNEFIFIHCTHTHTIHEQLHYIPHLFICCYRMLWKAWHWTLALTGLKEMQGSLKVLLWLHNYVLNWLGCCKSITNMLMNLFDPSGHQAHHFVPANESERCQSQRWSPISSFMYFFIFYFLKAFFLVKYSFCVWWKPHIQNQSPLSVAFIETPLLKNIIIK